MPKKGGGKKNRKPADAQKRELQFKEDGQDYAIVDKMLGNGWALVTCTDGEKKNAHIRGAFRKKVWINPGDVVLLGLREFENQQSDGLKKADIILKYTPDEARLLKSYGELQENVQINDAQEGGDDEVDINFEIDDI